MVATMELLAVPTAVVQNDKPAKAKKATVTAVKPAATAVPTAEKKAETLVEMETKRQNWETTAYRTSNQQLYAVLADCLAYGNNDVATAAAKARTAELEAFCVFRPIVTTRSGIVTADFGVVTGWSGIVTDRAWGGTPGCV